MRLLRVAGSESAAAMRSAQCTRAADAIPARSCLRSTMLYLSSNISAQHCCRLVGCSGERALSGCSDSWFRRARALKDEVGSELKFPGNAVCAANLAKVGIAEICVGI